jgi:integrase
MGCKRGRKPKTDKNYRKSPKGQSLRKGESYREDKGLYYFQYRDSLNRKRVIYRKDIMALRKIEDEVKQDLADNIRTYEAAHITINDGFDQYMSIKHELKPSTRAGYIDTYNRYVRNTIGNKLLKDIKYSDAKRFYSYLLEERNLSIPTVESVQTLLHPIFSFAVRDDIIRKNPTDGIMKELKGSWNYEKKERVVLTREQAIALLDYVENHPMFYHWLTILTVLIGSGMRISELCGLRWVDVDFKKREISINHHVVYRRFEGDKKMCLHVLTPKTKKGCRIIPMHDEVYHALLAEYAHQSATGFCTAEVDGWSGFIFKNRFGGEYIVRARSMTPFIG